MAAEKELNFQKILIIRYCLFFWSNSDWNEAFFFFQFCVTIEDSFYCSLQKTGLDWQVYHASTNRLNKCELIASSILTGTLSELLNIFNFLLFIYSSPLFLDDLLSPLFYFFFFFFGAWFVNWVSLSSLLSSLLDSTHLYLYLTWWYRQAETQTLWPARLSMGTR